MKPVASLAAALSLAITLPAAAQTDAQTASEPITIGTSHRVTTHGSERRINVILPPGYAQSGEEYPLVLILDGGQGQDLFMAVGINRWNGLWGRSQEAIIVGIETVDRQRELLPKTRNTEEQERYPTAGEAEQFRAWLVGEILPMLRAQYRDDGRAFLIGESAAGHFVAETWAEQPGSFTGYAALSPSFQWDEQSLSLRFANMPAMDRPPLFVSLADEGGTTEEGAMRFIAAAGPSACFADRRETHVKHSNTLHQLLPEALQFLLPTTADWLEEYGMSVHCDSSVAQ
ncbi:alpha/beta hydrolase [Erythrobacter sp. JK5]|uniref:alpha/beta hydrolase n=1 Tax=Erythrobacter sp. JK5 TaxID=2829500 RepID=UPI001BA54DBA|nr:alpha/beta hydrolase-fold protein [Erythrobacter sp. JK5]QUL38929.1 alpha/beta hydrolase [Erythrobacter sp. JK5]